jgi:hypothetical protein
MALIPFAAHLWEKPQVPTYSGAATAFPSNGFPSLRGASFAGARVLAVFCLPLQAWSLRGGFVQGELHPGTGAVKM